MIRKALKIKPQNTSRAVIIYRCIVNPRAAYIMRVIITLEKDYFMTLNESP